MLLSGGLLGLSAQPARAQTPAATPAETPASAPTRPPAAPPVVTPAAPAAAASAPMSPGDAAAEDAELQGVTWALTIEAPDALRPVLERYLDLARYQRADRKEGITRGELMRLLSAAPAQVRQLLETEGYFGAKARTELPQDSGAPSAGTQAATAPPATAATPPATTTAAPVIQVRLWVDPGPRTTVGGLRLDVHGELATAAAAGDGPARALIEQLRRQWALPNGQPFTREGWDDAKTAVLTLLRTEGYPAASWAHSAAQVDAQAHQAKLQLDVASGPLFRFGSFSFEGLSQVRLDAVLALRNVATGEPLREQALLNYQDRLVKTGLFDTVAVTYDPDPELAQATPILVRVRERSLQQATTGVGISDLSGPRVTLEHLHQRPFDLGWQAKTKLQLGRDARSLSLDLTSHPQPGPYRNLVAGSLSETEASGLRVISERLRLGRTQDTERIERTYYVELQRAFTRDLATNLVTDDTSAASVNYQWVWRRFDHPVLPTQGWGISADGAVGHSFATEQRSGWFSRGNARLTAYWTPGENWYGQTRMELGEVFSRNSVAVPYTLLFRAGGDDSVRGYGYQSLGPTDATGSAVGGRVLATGSLELARPFSLKHPAWWGAVFADAGNAATGWNTWSAAWGYGAGVRWRSPVGALRVDLAWGQQLRRLRLHFTVGITL
ncbi:autotransporter assembly complex protein TamA [Sphaerotilus microaerophilus]|nr:BamA/TamA family outer membrane protein [Sphaerotilus sp. FB-5]